jgi:hypothetical protein
LGNNRLGKRIDPAVLSGLGDTQVALDAPTSAKRGVKSGAKKVVKKASGALETGQSSVGAQPVVAAKKPKRQVGGGGFGGIGLQ